MPPLASRPLPAPSPSPATAQTGPGWPAAQALQPHPIGAALDAVAGWLLPLLLGTLLLLQPDAALAEPGLCVGPVCGDAFTRSAQYHWQLRLRVSDQRGHRERLVVDCRTGGLSPSQGLVERGYAAAVARRACRLAGEASG